MICHVLCAYPLPQAAFPFLLVQKLKAFRYWFAMKTRIGVLLVNLDDFDDKEAAITCTHMTYDQGMTQRIGWSGRRSGRPTFPKSMVLH